MLVTLDNTHNFVNSRFKDYFVGLKMFLERPVAVKVHFQYCERPTRKPIHVLTCR